MARQKGLEPLTYCLEGSCSIQLSYWRKVKPGAVSYTHLDVYKRQTYNQGDIPLKNRKTAFSLQRKRFTYIYYGSPITPVSYTHLDVYKRQAVWLKPPPAT